MLYTTLRKIQENDPYSSELEKLRASLGDIGVDTPIGFDTILKSNGLDDALWALRVVEGHDREIRLLACDFAEHVLPNFEAEHPGDNRARNCIDTARRFARGEATAEEMAAARTTEWYVAWSVAWSYARTAAWSVAGYAAGYAAWSVAGFAEWSAAGFAEWSALVDAAGFAEWSALVDAEIEWQKQRFVEWLNEVGHE